MPYNEVIILSQREMDKMIKKLIKKAFKREVKNDNWRVVYRNGHGHIRSAKVVAKNELDVYIQMKRIFGLVDIMGIMKS